MSVEKKLAKFRKEFYRVYHGKISKLLSGFEEKRKKTFNIMLLSECIIILIMGNFMYFAFQNANIELLMTLGFIVLFLILAVYGYFNGKFVKEVKSYCMRPILNIFGNIQWGNEDITDSELQQSELFSHFNRRFTDDNFSGEYRGVQFAISETNLEHESGSGKNRRCVKVFDGVVIKFKSNKDIKAKTVVATRGDFNIGVGGKWLFILISTFFLVLMSVLLFTGQMVIESIVYTYIAIGMIIFSFIMVLMNKEKPLKIIKLEDPRFEKRFKVYSQDEVEGRYLITTSFMERLLNLKTAFGARNVKCSFYGNNVMFAISTGKNLFEMGNILSGMENPRQMQVFFEEFSSIMLLVNYFKLDKKIGL